MADPTNPQGAPAPTLPIYEPQAQLFAALAKAQGEFQMIEKTQTGKVKMKEEKGGGEYTWKYADLSAVLAAVRPALSKHGLAVFHTIVDEPTNRRALTAFLVHSSGELIRSRVEIPLALAPQQLGSYLTYMRRYTISALLGIAAEDDDDGDRAEAGYQQGNPRFQKPNRVSTPKPGEPIGPSAVPNPLARRVGNTELAQIQSSMKRNGWEWSDVLGYIAKTYRTTKITTLTLEQFNAVLAIYNKPNLDLPQSAGTQPDAPSGLDDVPMTLGRP